MLKFSRILPVLTFYSLVISLFIFGLFIGNQAVLTISEISPIERKQRIVIDAGHGGEDGGAVSCAGQKESTINLQIALRLNDFFHLFGYETVMIRTNDTAVYTKGKTLAQKKISDLQHRVKIVEQTDSALLVSIHQNTFPENKYFGAQVFYADTAGSDVLADRLQHQLSSCLYPESKREAKRGKGIYLLDNVHSVGILVECGFLSNPKEETMLRTPKYQKKICCIIASEVSKFAASP